MAISIGSPITYDDVASAINTHYPEYAYVLAPDFTGHAPKVTFDSLDPDFYQRFAAFLAMICPPNMTVRPMFFAGFPWDGDVPPLQGLGPEFQSGHPIVAPDTFQELSSAVWPVGGDPAVNEINLAVDNYRLANPTVRVLGTLVARYSDGVNEAAIGKICGRLIP